jgi:hypothetical protein
VDVIGPVCSPAPHDSFLVRIKNTRPLR